MDTLSYSNPIRLIPEHTMKIINSALNSIDDLESAVKFIITNIKILTKCEAVAIRLHDGKGDYPYFMYDGFDDSFIIKENCLCVKDENGNKVRALDGQSYLLECMCVNIIKGNFDANLSWFTEHGSFFSNNTSILLNSNSEAELLGKTRKYCNFCGYESVALIPIKSQNKVIGLIQLNDMKQGMFKDIIINYLEMLGENIGLAIENYLLRNKSKESEAAIRVTLAKVKMLEDFFINITHEFKTPIEVIDSAVQAMEHICKNELSDKLKMFLNKIRQNNNRQFKFVNHILDITHVDYFKIKKVNIDIFLLTRTIIESITTIAEQKCISISFESTLSKKIIGLDDEKYERILLNLLSNAIKFTPKGKTNSTICQFY